MPDLKRMFGLSDEDYDAKLKTVVDDLMQLFRISYIQKRAQLIQTSFPFIDNRSERRRRLRLIQEMAVAKAKLEEANTIFGLAFVDHGIAAIIDGDWKEARELAEGFLYKTGEVFTKEDEASSVRYRELHAVFHDILTRAVNEALPMTLGEITILPGGSDG